MADAKRGGRIWDDEWEDEGAGTHSGPGTAQAQRVDSVGANKFRAKFSSQKRFTRRFPCSAPEAIFRMDDTTGSTQIVARVEPR